MKKLNLTVQYLMEIWERLARDYWFKYEVLSDGKIKVTGDFEGAIYTTKEGAIYSMITELYREINSLDRALFDRLNDNESMIWKGDNLYLSSKLSNELIVDIANDVFKSDMEFKAELKNGKIHARYDCIENHIESRDIMLFNIFENLKEINE